MATVLDICNGAMREIGALALEEQASAAEAQQCLRKFNEMVEAWNTENLAIYSVQPLVFPVVANKQSYTMGVGGDFNVPRPVLIEVAMMRDALGNDYPMDIQDYNSYSQIISKTVTSSIPTVMYDDQNFPLKTLRFWPVAADASFSFVLWCWQQILGVSALGDTLALPPGYNRGLQYNLAIEIAPSFGVTPSATLMKLAAESKGSLKKINYDVKRLQFPSNLVDRRAYGYYAILTGQ